MKQPTVKNSSIYGASTLVGECSNTIKTPASSNISIP